MTPLGDIFGHKQIFSFGLLALTIFSAVISGVTSSLLATVILRAIQGIAAAATIPTAYALVATTFEGKAREMAVAAIGPGQCVGIILGTIRKGLKRLLVRY